METTNKFDTIKSDINKLLAAMEVDADKFYNKEQKAAGVRLRKHYKGIKQYIHEASNQTSPKK
jgi:hypothetical protein